MVSHEGTGVTERQVVVLELREAGHTHREVAEILGTTDSNVSAIERAAERNVEETRRTLELVRTLRSPIRFTVEAGTSCDTLVDTIYEHGDETDTRIDYRRPELYAHLYDALEECVEHNQFEASVEIGLTRDGDVEVFTDDPEDDRERLVDAERVRHRP